MHSIVKIHSAQSHTPSKRRKSIKPSNWPHLLTGYRVTSALIKCVDAIKVERASLLYVHVGIEKNSRTMTRERKGEKGNSILIAQSVSQTWPFVGFFFLRSFGAAANGHVNYTISKRKSLLNLRDATDPIANGSTREARVEAPRSNKLNSSSRVDGASRWIKRLRGICVSRFRRVGFNASRELVRRDELCTIRLPCPRPIATVRHKVAVLFLLPCTVPPTVILEIASRWIGEKFSGTRSF